MRKISSILIAAGIVCLAATVSAQHGTKSASDDRVERILRAAELKYEIDGDGDFKLIDSFDDGRTHVVFINSNTSELGSFEIREIWAAGFHADDITPEQMRMLLSKNSTVKLGAWRISKMGEKTVAIFAVQIEANTDQKSMVLALHAVTSTADEMEKEVTGKDDL